MSRIDADATSAHASFCTRGILEQQSGAFVTVITFGLATSGQRKVTRQTINKALDAGSAHDVPSLRLVGLKSKHAFPFRRIGLNERFADANTYNLLF